MIGWSQDPNKGMGTPKPFTNTSEQNTTRPTSHPWGL
jgi:hypothetical protein